MALEKKGLREDDRNDIRSINSHGKLIKYRGN